MQDNFARCRAFDVNHIQFITNLVTIGNLPERERRRIGKRLATREDRCGELLGKPSRGTVVVGTRYNNSRNTTGTNKLVERFALQRNWINKIRTVASDKAV